MMNYDMSKEEFVNAFRRGIENEFATEVRVGIQMPDFPSLEYIHNSEENFEKKLEYYVNAYDDNMCLKTFPRIQIKEIEFYHSEGGFWVDIRDFD